MTGIEARGGHQPVRALASRLPRVRLPDTPSAPDDRAPEEFLHLVRARVCTAGWIAVGSREDGVVYSVGLTQWGWPELVVPLAGSTVEFALWLLAELVARAVQYGRVPRPGTVYVNHTQVMISEIEPATCRMACAMYRAGRVVRALRIEAAPESRS